MIDKVKYYLARFVVVLAFLLTVLAGYWFLYPYNPLEIKNVKLLTPEINRGGHLKFNIDYCKNMDLPSTVYVTFIDGLSYSPQPIVSNLELGCRNEDFDFYVPKALTADKLKIKVMYRYHPNPIRNVDIEITSDTFTITQ